MHALTKPQQLVYQMDKFVGGAASVVCGSALFSGHRSREEMIRAAKTMIRMNDALRTRIVETEHGTMQIHLDDCEPEISYIQFADKAALDSYAAALAKEPMDIYGALCEATVISMPEHYGILIKLHHIIGDAWTISMIGTQYSSLLNGTVPEVYQYKDYFAREAAYEQSERFEKDRSYFLDQFKKCGEMTYLAGQKTSSYLSDRETFVIEPEDSQLINAYAKEHQVSVFSLFMTALAVCFSRVHMNAERFFLGTAVLNRTGMKEKNTMGMFINTVPVLMDLRSDLSFFENLAGVKRTLFSVLKHQKYNYGEVLSDLRKEHHFTERLYDVTLSYQNAVIESENTVQSTWYPCGCQTDTLQIHVEDRDRENLFHIHYDYQVEKLSKEDVRKFHQHLSSLLLDAIRDDRKKLYELNLLTPAEEEQIKSWNRTDASYPKDACVHTLFEQMVRDCPAQTAVAASDADLTYQELNTKANRIAHGLMEKGVKTGDIVAFALPRNSLLPLAMIGILKAGAAFLPLDPGHPEERIRFMTQDCGAKLLLTEPVVRELLANGSAENPCVRMTSEALCYCIYTSGSTGKPKGVLIRHRNLVNNIFWRIRQYDIHAAVVSVTSVTADTYMEDFFYALFSRNPFVLTSDNRSLIEIASHFARGSSSVMTTPTYFKTIVENVDTSNLTDVILVGEALERSLADAVLPRMRLHNEYGPSECTICASYKEIDGEISIGSPVANTQIHIVDRYLRHMPVNAVGELCIAGDGVGAGYLGREELTAEKFVDNPFGEGKLYRTGDLARWREDGEIVYVGRNDFQVKIRGLRIELGEIENAIMDIEGISMAAVVVRKDEEGRQYICAFYTGEALPHAEIRFAIEKKLPQYMVPHVLTHMDELPMTPSGKCDRKALPEVALSAETVRAKHIAPRNDSERAIVSAAEMVLEVSGIGMLDSFIDLGGDSLKAIEMIAALQKTGYQMNIQTLLSCDTFEEAAGKLQRSGTPEAEAAQAADGSKAFPATPAQMRIYTAQSAEGVSTTYNVPYMFRAAELDPVRLQSAVDQLIQRHEILRTHFENRNGTVLQVVDEAASCPLEHWEQADIIAFMRPFDFEKSPLMRVGYCGSTVMLDLHHIVFDGGSFPVLMHELNELYMGRELTEPAVQYRRYSGFSGDVQADRDYWLSIFDDPAPILELPTDEKRGDRQSHRGGAFYDRIGNKLHGDILHLCREQGITPFVFYMAAYTILLSKYSGSEDVVVGMPVSGRRGALLNTIGMMVNTVVLRSRPEGNKTVAEYLREVREASIFSIRHQDYSYSEIVKDLGLKRNNRNPLFDHMLAYQSDSMTEIQFGDQKAEAMPIPIMTSKYDFSFYLMPSKDDAVLMVEYCSDLYHEMTIRHFTQVYRQILRQMLRKDLRLLEIDPVLPEERRILMEEFNKTDERPVVRKCVHTMFEEYAASDPDKTAVIACDRTLSYRELNHQANCIANALTERKIGRGDIVAFALPRCSWIPAVMLGILKCGAAYLPIDPSNPGERIDYMLRDSGAKWFVTPDSIAALLSCGAGENLDSGVEPEDPCYCIYTSGSTGKPKAVVVTHGNVMNYVSSGESNVLTNFIRSSANRIVSVTTVSFDIFATESLLPLSAGLSIVFADEKQAVIQSELDSLVKRCGADLLQTTPTKMRLLIADPERRNYLRNLKGICLGGEILDPLLVQELMALTDAKIFNIYGPTETTIWSTNALIQDPTDVTIGKPVSNTRIYIVDSYMKLVPVGVTGELCIAGDGVSMGYLNRPELTEQRFVDNPFGAGKLYKTGDLACWRKDGNIVYVGRNDFQVKIRGLRIELGELESVISSVEGITLAAVVERRDSARKQYLCAFYSGKEYPEKELRARIAEKLPQYMIPHVFKYLDKMPLTTSGKVNRKGLPEVALIEEDAASQYDPPVSELEKQLAALMEHVLDYRPIGQNHNFFELGGDSLGAIELVSCAHQECIYIPLQAVFDAPDLKELARMVESGDRQKAPFAAEDFSAIHHALEKNRAEWIVEPQETPVGDALFAGATGFLGAHLLSEYLKTCEGTAWCLVRGKDEADSRKRLLDRLTYYFGDTFSENHRIRVICADLNQDRFGMSEQSYAELASAVDTVINAAATVKHYGSYQYFYEMNVETVKRMITFCGESGAKLIHMSTTSVTGDGIIETEMDPDAGTEKVFYEKDLYVGQVLDNVYVRSKFEAEKEILEAMTHGLRANIMRMGNLTNRLADGVFQPNYQTNAFLKRMKAFMELGGIPEYLSQGYVEFTPVDEAAKAVMTIVRHFDPERNTFHICSSKVLYVEKLIAHMNTLGRPFFLLDEETFQKRIRDMAQNPETSFVQEALINELDQDDRLNFDHGVYADCSFTETYLRILGFEWSEIGLEYLRKYLSFFEEKGFLKRE